MVGVVGVVVATVYWFEDYNVRKRPE
jgi:hypothetical protein